MGRRPGRAGRQGDDARMADWRMADWVVVVPAKRLGAAKSRLRGAVDPARHEDLALAMVRDTVEAVRACVEVVQVLLVTDEPALITATAGPGVQAVADPGGGLNAAARFGADGWAGPGRRRAVLTGDLPGLRADDLTAALHAAGTTGGRAFVRDAAGTGTVLLTAGVGIALDPRFGAGSALAHARSGAHELAGDWPGLCRDVDTADDLWAVLGMGAGRHTCAVARDLGLTAGCRTG